MSGHQLNTFPIISWTIALRRHFIDGLIGTACVRLGGIGIGFATTIFLARLLGPSEYGVYAYVIAVITLLAVPVQFGLPTLVVRETARARETESWGLMLGLWYWSPLVVGILSLFVGLATLVGITLIEQYLHPDSQKALAYGLTLLPFVAWVALAGAAMSGLQRVVLGQLSENLLRPGFLLLFLVTGLTWFPSSEFDAIFVLVLTIFAAILAFLVSYIILYLIRPKALTGQYPKYSNRSWFSSAWPLALVTGLQILNHQTDLLMLGVLATTTEVGIYRVVSQIALLAVFGLQIVNMVVAPRIATLHTAGKVQRLQKLITRSSQITLLVALPLTIALIVFGEAIISVLFGEKYAPGYTPLIVLTIGQLCNAGMGSVGLLLNMTGHERTTVKGVTIAILLNIPLNTLLIPVWGMTGAALASASSLIVWNVILWQASWHILDIDTTAIGLKKHSKSP